MRKAGSLILSGTVRHSHSFKVSALGTPEHCGISDNRAGLLGVD